MSGTSNVSTASRPSSLQTRSLQSEAASELQSDDSMERTSALELLSSTQASGNELNASSVNDDTLRTAVSSSEDLSGILVDEIPGPRVMQRQGHKSTNETDNMVSLVQHHESHTNEELSTSWTEQQSLTSGHEVHLNRSSSSRARDAHSSEGESITTGEMRSPSESVEQTSEEERLNCMTQSLQSQQYEMSEMGISRLQSSLAVESPSAEVSLSQESSIRPRLTRQMQREELGTPQQTTVQEVHHTSPALQRPPIQGSRRQRSKGVLWTESELAKLANLVEEHRDVSGRINWESVRTSWDSSLSENGQVRSLAALKCAYGKLARPLERVRRIAPLNETESPSEGNINQPNVTGADVQQNENSSVEATEPTRTGATSSSETNDANSALRELMAERFNRYYHIAVQSHDRQPIRKTKWRDSQRRSCGSGMTSFANILAAGTPHGRNADILKCCSVRYW
ncbi:hypothetical protein OSTOST_06987 [Ostertagia ostertagi]